MSRRDPLYLSPGEAATLQFNAATTVSGLLDYDEVYRVTADADCWIMLDKGGDGGELTALGSGACLLTANGEVYLRTTQGARNLRVIGEVTSGLFNYTRMDE